MSGDFPPRTDDGVLRVPARGADRVELQFAPVAAEGAFDPGEWRHAELSADPDADGWYRVDLADLDVPDGRYRYEFIVHGGGGNGEDRGEGDGGEEDRDDGNGDAGDGGPTYVSDPFAEEVVRFDGTHSAFRIRDGERVRPSLSWDGELPDGGLPGNDELVIYELPPRWTAPASPDHRRNVPDGDFQDLLTSHLDELAELGVTAIELLPIQDSPDTTGWGYDTRFFFAPARDLGDPVDVKFLVRECHRRGIRVILDVVINHATDCPLAELAPEWFFLDPDEKPDRESWGGRRFDFEADVGGMNPAGEFLCRMGEYWVEEYRVDGFRLDEFKGVDNWRFVRSFRDRTHAAHEGLSDDRPFVVIAEDSWARTQIVHDDEENPDGRAVVDSMWNFEFKTESRRLLRDEIATEPDEAARSERVRALIAGDTADGDAGDGYDSGFADLTRAVNYVTSHDVGGEGDQRLMNRILGDLVREHGLGDGSVDNLTYLLDSLVARGDGVRLDAHAEAVDRVRGAFGLLLTSAGIPMFLAGEEFADVHDLDYTDWRLKMEDPVDWSRMEYPGHAELRERVGELIDLRTSTEALRRKGTEFLYTHPTMDEPDGDRAFAYCRTADRELGSEGQVVVVANGGARAFDDLEIPWYWGDEPAEHGEPLRESTAEFAPDEERATLSLAPFGVRVFST